MLLPQLIPEKKIIVLMTNKSIQKYNQKFRNSNSYEICGFKVKYKVRGTPTGKFSRSTYDPIYRRKN